MAITGALAAAARVFDPYPQFATALVFKGRPETGGRPFYKHRGIIAPRFEMLPGAFSLGNAGLAWRPVNGAMRRAAADEPVIGDDGILHHELRTNSIRNPVMAGAVVGAPNSLPTGWSTLGGQAGLARTLVAVGVANGAPYVDIRWSGTPDATASQGLYLVGVTTQAAVVGQVWTAGLSVRLVDGDLTNVGAIALGIYERNSAGGGLTQSSVGVLVSGNPPPARITRTLSDGAAAYVTPGVAFAHTNGVPVDFTLRFALPYFSLGPDINDPPILQETGLPATRTLPVQGLEGGLPQGPLTVIATQGAVPNVAAAGGGLPRFFELSNSDNTRALLVLRRASNGFNIEGVGGDNGAGNNSSLTPVNSTARARVALSFDGTSLTAAANGQAGPAATPGASISALSRLFLQNNPGGNRTANSNLEDLFIARGAVSAGRLAELSAL